MATAKASTFTLSESTTNGAGNKRFQTLRSLPRSWLVAAAIFYCASVLTVGLLAGLLPRRTQTVTVLATPTQADSTTTMTMTTTRNITTGTTTQAPSSCVDDECNPRLASDLIVHSYQLEYMYNSSQQTTVPGKVTIEFTLKQPVRQLIYHAKGMVSLDEPALFEDDVYRLVSMRRYVPNDYISLRLTTDGLLARNRYRLVQNFVASLTEGSMGFYQSSFNDVNGTTGKLLSTQFQATDARRAFPCFDEPQLKARFTVTMIHPENTIALANFPTAEESLENGLRRTKFAETFPMSTYLAAWAVLPNTYGKRNDNDDEAAITIWARREPTEKNHTALALQVASQSVNFFATYFDTSEPVPPKIDLLAVPEFSAGAMENWGLVTFREDRLIFDDKIASTAQKHRLGETIAHELAHFWFGNYVTCKWWTDLWLNEAMATWLSYKPFAASFPSWNMNMDIFTEDIINSMWDDAKPSSHPILVQNVTDPGEITSLFDSITYSKGASILRMLESIAGSKKFQEGLQEYLRINAFSVGDPSYFYNKLFTNSSGEEFMKNWLQEMNFPLLNVTLRIENGDTKLTFTQSRFIISQALNTSQLNPNYRWKIAVRCILGGTYPSSDTTSPGNDTIDFLLESEQETKTISGKAYSWIKCNRDFEGYYLTQYSFESNTYQRFASVLEAQPAFFSDEDKANFLQDTFLLAYKGLIDYMEPLRMMHSLVKTNTQQSALWRIFQWHWDRLAHVIEHLPDTLSKFRNFAIQQVLSNSETLDSILSLDPNDYDNIKLLKSVKFDLLCRMNHPDANKKATELFRSIPTAYFSDNNVTINISGDHLTTVYTSHIKNEDNEADWNTMYNYYQVAISPQEQLRALMAISSTSNKDRLNRLLNEGLRNSSSTIKRQDYFSMIGFMSRHPVGREAVWTFYKDNFQRLIDTFTLENHGLGVSILSISRSFEKPLYLQEMNDLFTKYPNAGAGVSARKQAIDQVKMNIEWIQSQEMNLRTALDAMLQQ